MIGVTQVCLMVLLVALVPSPPFLYFIVPCWKSWLLYLGKAQQWQDQCYSFLLLCAVLSWVQTVVWLPVFGVKVCTDVDVYDCRRGCRDILRVSVLEADWPVWEKNPLPHSVSIASGFSVR